MSLINQMLRDLQKQNKADGSTKPAALRPKMMERIPYLPMPVVLGGVALALLCLVWWLAGALSEMMFGFEPIANPGGSQPVAVAEPSSTAGQPVLVAAEPDQLTMAERHAEPPTQPVVNDVPAAKASASDEVQPVEGKAVEKKSTEKPYELKPVTAKAAAVAGQPSGVAKVKRKQEPASPRATAKTLPVQSRSVTAPVRVVDKAQVRLHPDDLPGAVLNRPPAQAESQPLAARPSKLQATTPYGQAEEAYRDGEWAFSQHRNSLAVMSLQQSLELYAGHLPAREMLVDILVADGKTGEAMFLLAEGLEIAPDYIAFKKKYARLLVEQGDYDAATKVMLKGGLPTVEKDPEAHVVLASLYQRLGEPFLAAQTYRNLLVAWPQTGAFWVGLGGALEGQHLSEEAVVCYKRALSTKDLRQDLSQYAKKRLSLLN